MNSTELFRFLGEDGFPKAVRGLSGPSEAYFLARWTEVFPEKPLVRITPDLKSGITLKQDIQYFLGEADSRKLLWFPPHDHLPYTGIVGDTDTMADRLSALKRLLEGDYSLLVVPWQALLRNTIPKKYLRNFQLTLSLHEEMDRDLLVEWLSNVGYQREVVVEMPGETAVRGGLVDVFSPQESFPFRIEFFGDKVESIRYFDPATQTTLKKSPPQKVTFIPAHEILFLEELITFASGRLKTFADTNELPTTLRREVMEKLKAKVAFAGIETFLPIFFEEKETVLDYVGERTVLILPDEGLLREETQKFREDAEGLYRETKSPERLIPPEAVVNTFTAIEKKLKEKREIFINPLARLETEAYPLAEVRIENSSHVKEVWRSRNVEVWRSADCKIEMICHTPVQAERLKDLLRTKGLPPYSICLGKLSEGFYWPAERKVFLTEEEIFGHKTVRRTKSTQATAAVFTSFADLKQGDYLVHEDYGVNRYLGLKHMSIGNVAGDYLQLRFLGEDKLYLPVYRLNAVQKYIGAETEGAALDALGGVRWKKLKERAGKEVYKIAGELLKIHAQRMAHSGIGYPPPDEMDETFASHFPYDETPDQSNAIADILEDMQNTKPMDRLVCGDVGYGKTEVAMRAAFKAVNSGKQVLFLVPTTILALQHFETFQKRFEKLPVTIDMLSRFRSTKEQKQTIENLKTGKTDIVIGTHRLLARDVKVKEPGLLILDEEHRFGVRHKERIKKIKPTVDVLTLSATPIPRTLHMSLIGLKDLSIIHTPPVDRVAIRTYTARWDDAVVKHAIQKELAREGQVFFVHNRVATIQSMYNRLAKMFPAAKIAVGHGQMEEATLEKVMIDFLHQRTDILLSTTIIESGIDVPTANTMIINRADTFGLAQLYQLRGRVGRSDVQAYCYLLVPDEEILTREARKRLEALTRHTALGAGFQIAQQDLEIRGSGNLLGTSQSGFIEEVGYELYTKLLNRAIRRLKGEEITEEIDPEIQIGVSAFIPESYVGEASLRMELYKRLSHLKEETEIEAFERELSDRFGALPEEVKNLIGIMAVKSLAAKLRIRSLKCSDTTLAVEWDPSTPVSSSLLIRKVAQEAKHYQMKPSGVLAVRIDTHTDSTQKIESIKKRLRLFMEMIKESP